MLLLLLLAFIASLKSSRNPSAMESPMNARRNSFEKEEAFVVVVVVFVVVVSAVSPLAADDADDFFKPSSTALFASSSSFAATPSSSSLRAAAALIFFFPRALSLSSYVVLVKQRADFVTALFSFSFSLVTAFFFGFSHASLK